MGYCSVMEDCAIWMYCKYSQVSPTILGYYSEREVCKGCIEFPNIDYYFISPYYATNNRRYISLIRDILVQLFINRSPT